MILICVAVLGAVKLNATSPFWSVYQVASKKLPLVADTLTSASGIG